MHYFFNKVNNIFMRFYDDIILDYADISTGEKDFVLKRVTLNSVTVTTSAILTDEVSKKYMKRKGQYVTVESEEKKMNRDVKMECARILSRELNKMLSKYDKKSVLAVGLGNEGLTADSLGPLTIKKLEITRHYFEEGISLPNRYGSLAGFCPGVLGVTGIESYDMICSVVERLHPSAVILVDTLSSSKVRRLANAFQLSDAGLHPGAGVGNPRKELNDETLKVPVLAIGVPLVLYAKTIAEEILNKYLDLTKVTSDYVTRAVSVNEVLKSGAGELIVTPKDIDNIVFGCASVIAAAINNAIHKTTIEEAILE